MSDENRNKGGRAGKKKKPGKKRRAVTIVFGVIVSLILVVMLAACVVFQHFYGMMNISDGKISGDMIGTVISPGTDTADTEDNSNSLIYSDNVYNILLLGSDSRAGSTGGLSDVMMLVSINKETKQILMSSFLRDIYVDIPGFGGEKLNAANAFGGPALTIETIEKYFDIDINAYAAIDFISFVKVVDTLGGVDGIELSNQEIYYINYYLPEINGLLGTDESTDVISGSAGTYHLTGRQALSYCRNRYVGTDFARTERQRNILSKLWAQFKNTSLTELYSIARDVLPSVTTDLSQSDCISLMFTVTQIKDYELVSQHIPADDTYTFDTINGMSVVSIDFEENKRILRETIYGE